MNDVVTGEAVVLDVRVARLPSRMAALCIDLAVQVITAVVVLLLAAGIGSVADTTFVQAIVLVIIVGVIVGYPTASESLWRGKSLGKAALGLRVVGEDGGPERFRQALLRALAGVVEIWLTFGAVALIASLSSERGRRLGDVFAGTLAVRERMPVRGGQVATMPPQLASWAATLELSGLPGDAALTARQFLSRYQELAPQVRDDMAARIASGVAARVSPPPPPGTPPMAYLSAVLAERRGREEARLGGPHGPYEHTQAGQRAPGHFGYGWPPAAQGYGQPSPATSPPTDHSPQPYGSPATHWQTARHDGTTERDSQAPPNDTPTDHWSETRGSWAPPA